jgi:hypothetical protein
MRKLRTLFLVSALLSLTSSARSQATNLLAGITLGAYSGWTNCLALNDENRRYQAVIAPDVGGRVLHYSHDLINILYRDKQADGRTLSTSSQPFYVGGFQTDIGPEIHGVPVRNQISLGRHEWRGPRDYTVETASPVDSGVGLRVLKSFTLDANTGELGILQRMINSSARELRYCIWDRTVCKGGGFVFFKLNPDSRFENGWSILSRNAEGFHYAAGQEQQGVQTMDDHLVISTGTTSAKIGADSLAGWIAYVRDKLLFIKYFPVSPGGNYADGGNTVEVMWTPTITELSPLSPAVRLAPGTSYDFPERWMLIPLDKPVMNARAVKKLLKRIPPNPFGG